MALCSIIDDEVKLWYDFVSRSREEVTRTRRFIFSIFLSALGVIWILISQGKWIPIDYPTSTGIFLLIVLIAILQSQNVNLARQDYAFSDIQFGILNGRLTNRESIMKEYQPKFEKILKASIQKGYNEVVDRLKPKE